MAAAEPHADIEGTCLDLRPFTGMERSGAAPSRLHGRASLRPSGAAQESNLPIVGLPLPAGFEDGAELALGGASRVASDHLSDHRPRLSWLESFRLR